MFDPEIFKPFHDLSSEQRVRLIDLLDQYFGALNAVDEARRAIQELMDESPDRVHVVDLDELVRPSQDRALPAPKPTSSIGERVRELRRKADMTQGELAKATGITAGYLSQVENNRFRPTDATLKKIASAFKITTERLMHLEP